MSNLDLPKAKKPINFLGKGNTFSGTHRPFRELHHQELQTNVSFNEQPKEMLPVTNESNHSAVILTSTNNKIEISIISKNLRRNDITKSISETPTVEMEMENGMEITSSHSEHTKKSVVYSQALRLSCICSE